MSLAVTHRASRLLLTKPVLNTSVVSFINTTKRDGSNSSTTTNDGHYTVGFKIRKKVQFKEAALFDSKVKSMFMEIFSNGLATFTHVLMIIWIFLKI